MKHFLDFVLRRLATHPDDVDVREVTEGSLVAFKVNLHPEDIGRVIGKNGRTISAIRSLLTACASRTDTRVTVDILEPVQRPA
jgi:predicted RNA-binding protein YlqC (UPF0109 family)